MAHRTLAGWVVAGLAAVLGWIPPGHAQLVDTSFGSGGYVRPRAGSSWDEIYAVRVQPDGKIVAAGKSFSATYQRQAVALARYNADGSPDTTFGTQGSTWLQWSSSYQGGNAMVLQPDGKIVVAGEGYNEFSQPVGAVARLNANGTLDPSFGSGGVLLLPLIPGPIFALARQPDGRIVAVGGYNNIYLQRLEANGATDTTFGTNGAVNTPLPGQKMGYAVALQTDGRIVVAGAAANDFLVVRYTPQGALDTTFGAGNGFALETVNGPSNDIATSLAIQADGKIVVGGTSNLTFPLFALMRLTAAGIVDPTFGVQGRAVTSFSSGTADQLNALAILPDGKIVAAGDSGEYGDDGVGIKVARFSADGVLDPTFGSGGTMEAGTPKARTRALAILDADKLVVAGSNRNLPGSSADFTVTRFNANGSADLSFGNNGTTGTADVLRGTLRGTSTATLPNGRLVTAGWNNGDDGSLNAYLVGYTAAGQHDPAFGGGAPVSTGFSFNTLLTVPLVPLASGKFLTGGLGPGAFAFSRYNGDGTLDTTFGSGTGSAASAAFNGSLRALLVQPDGRIVAGGSGGGSGFALQRYLASGALDPTFAAGAVATDVGEELVAIALQPDGKVLAVGNDYNPTTSSTVMLVRYKADGTLDTAFGTGGKIIVFNSGVAGGVAVQADGRIVVLASATNFNTRRDLALARYNPDGSTDFSFGTNGRVFAALNPEGYDTQANALLLREGRIVVAGSLSSNSGSNHVFLARFAANGFPDLSFGQGGYAFVTPSTRFNYASSLSQQADGSLLLAGFTLGPSIDGEAYVLRLLAPLDAAYDYDGDGVADVVEAAEGLNPLVKDNDVFTSPRLFAMQQYRDFLGREGEASGLVYYQDLINGGVPRAGVIEGFLASSEFQLGLPQCTRLYFSFFRRIPDYAGLMFQVGQYRAGVPLESIAQNFFNAPEFTNTYGALTNDQYITLVYQNVLGRAPDAGGFEFYKNLLDTGAITRGQMMIGFSESPEFQQLIANDVYVIAVYVGLLRRVPEPAGLDFYVDAIAAGMPRGAIINGFIGSPEYHNRFMP